MFILAFSDSEKGSGFGANLNVEERNHDTSNATQLTLLWSREAISAK